MWDTKQLIATIIIAISGALLIIGVPCWAVGSFRPEFYTSNVLVSLPIFPTTEDKLSYWKVVDPGDTGDYFTGMQSEKINFSLDSKFVEEFKKKITFYLLHNIHGLATSIQIKDAKGNEICDYSDFFNSIIGDLPNTSNTFTQMSEHPNELSKYGYYRVYCPFRTVITEKMGVSKSCKESQGTFMEIHENMSKRKVCSIEIDKVETPLSVTVNYMKVVPNDFIHTPQIYFCSWRKSNSYELTLTGSIVTTVGLICFIASVVIFFSMMLDSSQ